MLPCTGRPSCTQVATSDVVGIVCPVTLRLPPSLRLMRVSSMRAVIVLAWFHGRCARRSWCVAVSPVLDLLCRCLVGREHRGRREPRYCRILIRIKSARRAQLAASVAWCTESYFVAREKHNFVSSVILYDRSTKCSS